jgi:DNA polymerase III gamma/tau subunit
VWETDHNRCQKFSFGRLKEMEIVTRLQFLATKDALEVDEAALSLIAARANGSLHDAETTLYQLSLLDRRVSLAMVEELVSLFLSFTDTYPNQVLSIIIMVALIHLKLLFFQGMMDHLWCLLMHLH